MARSTTEKLLSQEQGERADRVGREADAIVAAAAADTEVYDEDEDFVTPVFSNPLSCGSSFGVFS